MDITVGAYPAYPDADHPEHGTARELLQALSDIPRVAGFEIPYRGYNEVEYWNGTWPRGAADPEHVTLTGIPGTMKALEEHPRYGLASPNEDGRCAALDFTRALNARARALVANGHVVKAALIHSAPSNEGSAGAFTRSLAEICSWDWYGVPVVVEHCDAANGQTRPQKAFLNIDDEVAAIRAVYQEMGIEIAAAAARVKLGISVNWGRSVLELGHPDGAIKHLQVARKCGYLRGFMLSGISDRVTQFGGAWEDAHMPPTGIGGAETDSLLTPEHIVSSWQAAGDDLLFKGLKVALRPAELSVTARVQQIKRILDLIPA